MDCSGDSTGTIAVISVYCLLKFKNKSNYQHNISQYVENKNQSDTATISQNSPPITTSKYMDVMDCATHGIDHQSDRGSHIMSRDVSDVTFAIAVPTAEAAAASI
jgi:hypothetical protein